MSLVVNHNLMAINTARNLNETYGQLSTSTRRLSSGLRVVSAADDAAGLAMRELMRADIQTLNQGMRNANDGISLIQTADGALQVIDAKLIRMKELAEQAATGTYTDTQRRLIDQEYQAMAKEITRIAEDTDFNSLNLLRGTNQDNPAKGVNLEATKTAVDAIAGLNTSYDDSGNLVITNSLTPAAAVPATYTINSGTGTAIEKTLAVPANGSVTIDKNGNTISPIPAAPTKATITAGLPDPAPAYSDNAKVEQWDYATSTWKEITSALPKKSAAGAAGDTAKGQPPRVRITDTIANGLQRIDEYVGDDGMILNVAGGGAAIAKDAGNVTAMTSTQVVPTSTVTATYDVTNNDVTVEQWDYANSEWKSVPLGANTSPAAFGDTLDKSQPPRVRITEEFPDGSIRIDEYEGNDTMQLSVDATTGALTAKSALDVSKVSSKSVFEVDIHFGSSNKTSDHYSYQIEAMTAKSLGLGAEANNDVLTAEHAKLALDSITEAIIVKDEARANLGAMQNRLTATIENVSIQKENLQSSESRISDVDVATEMTEFTRHQIMAQTGVSMLAQANSLPKMAQKLIDAR